MNAVLINAMLAFVEGFALIISPCILPILPIVLSGSLAGNKSRPLGIIAGFIFSFTIVTLFTKTLITYTHLSADALRDTSYVILLMLGVIMTSTYLTEKFTLFTSRLTGFGSSIETANNPRGGFVSGMIFGCLIGIVWTPCAGPILAAVIVQTIVQHTTLSSMLVVVAFALGAGIPMLLIALIGRRMMEKFSFFRSHSALFRKILGLIIIASVFFLIYSTNITFAVSQSNNSTTSHSTLTNGLEHPYATPEIAGIEAWINSPPLQLSHLRGKVVLIDFWTYSCINCIRTLPYLKDWYAKYHDKGLEIIGIHSPEFEFEHDLDNVKNAVKKDGILYPVALDNDFITWQRFHNQYWPAHYLINQQGEIVYEHFGEGEYETTENNIRYLLGMNEMPNAPLAEQNYSGSITPETYLGYGRADSFSSPESLVRDKSSHYSYPATLTQDHWALKGEWAIYPEKIVATTPGASIKLHFNAREIYVVMGADNPIAIKVICSEKINNQQISVLRNQLYTVATFKKIEEGTIELIATKPGLEIYTFTFGN